MEEGGFRGGAGEAAGGEEDFALGRAARPLISREGRVRVPVGVGVLRRLEKFPAPAERSFTDLVAEERGKEGAREGQRQRAEAGEKGKKREGLVEGGNHSSSKSEQVGTDIIDDIRDKNEGIKKGTGGESGHEIEAKEGGGGSESIETKSRAVGGVKRETGARARIRARIKPNLLRPGSQTGRGWAWERARRWPYFRGA